MTRRIAVLLLVLSAYLVGPNGLSAAEPALPDPKIIGPQNDPPSVEQRLSMIEMRIEEVLRHLNSQQGTRQDDLTSASEQLAALQNRMAAIEEHSGQIAQRIDEINDTVTKMQKSDHWVDKPVSESETKLPAPVPKQGKFVIFNWTGISRYISVNGLRFYVSPGQTEMWVPYAPVEAYVPAYEFPKQLGMGYWRWTGRNYEMRLCIRS